MWRCWNSTMRGEKRCEISQNKPNVMRICVWGKCHYAIIYNHQGETANKIYCCCEEGRGSGIKYNLLAPPPFTKWHPRRLKLFFLPIHLHYKCFHARYTYMPNTCVCLPWRKWGFYKDEDFLLASSRRKRFRFSLIESRFFIKKAFYRRSSLCSVFTQTELTFMFKNLKMFRVCAWWCFQISFLNSQTNRRCGCKILIKRHRMEIKTLRLSHALNC